MTTPEEALAQKIVDQAFKEANNLSPDPNTYIKTEAHLDFTVEGEKILVKHIAAALTTCECEHAHHFPPDDNEQADKGLLKSVLHLYGHAVGSANQHTPWGTFLLCNECIQAQHMIIGRQG